MIQDIANRYKTTSQESLDYFKEKSKYYCRPMFGDYLKAIFIAPVLGLPLHILYFLTIWHEHREIEYFIFKYSIWFLFAYILFIILFIIPDRLYRFIGEILYIKSNVDQKPLWIEETSFGPVRRQDSQTPSGLWCERWRVISYILFSLFSVIIPLKVSPQHYTHFPLKSMSFIFSSTFIISFMYSWTIVEIYSSPKKEFSPRLKVVRVKLSK